MRALLHETFDRLGRPADHLVQPVGFVGRKSLQDEVGGLDGRGRAPDAYPQAGKTLIAQYSRRGNHTAVSSGTALLADTNAAERKVKIVMNHDEIFVFDRKITKQALERLAASVHVGLRFDQQDFFTVPIPFPYESFVLLSRDGDAVLLGQPVQHQKTQVVPGPFVFLSRIS